MKLSAFAFGLAAFALPASAVAQEARCIPQAQSRAVVANLLPDLITATTTACSRNLNVGAYLPANGNALAASLTPLADRSWNDARSGYEAVIGSQLPDSPELIAFGRKAIAEGIATELDAQACSTVDRLVAEIAPLPPQNFANVFALFLELGLNSSEDPALTICPARP